MAKFGPWIVHNGKGGQHLVGLEIEVQLVSRCGRISFERGVTETGATLPWYSGNLHKVTRYRILNGGHDA